ncbi:4Fe-4S binding protein, partial [Yersinia enterocolitica]
MNTNRRHFIVSMGALIFMTGSSGRSLALSGTIDGVRYGMLHDETRCIGCTACMDACREVNHVPAGVSRLNIIRSQPIGEFPAVKYQFYRHSCQHC